MKTLRFLCLVVFIAFMSFNPISVIEAKALSSEDKSNFEEIANVVIYLDAKRRWSWNRYDYESTSFSSFSNNTLTVDYTYNGGMRGWAELEFNEDGFKCIRYHDFQNICRSVNIR